MGLPLRLRHACRPGGYNETDMKARPANSTRRSIRERTPDSGRKNVRDSSSNSRRSLTEDEADILYGEKHKDEKGIPWDQVKANLDAMDR
jgi:hypothetical protein